MNQIVSTNNGQDPEQELNPEKRIEVDIINETNNHKGQIKEEKTKPVNRFVIIIILIILLIVGLYMFTDIGRNTDSTQSYKIPTITQEILENNILKITVTHGEELKQASYMWGESDEVLIECEGEKEIELNLDIPLGENVFTFSVEDCNGETAILEKKFVVDKGIGISVSGNNTIITAIGEDKFVNATYKWNEEEEIKIEIDSTEFIQQIDTVEGENTLTVTLVDENDKTITKTQTIIGVLEPTIMMGYVGENIVFKLEDKDELKDFVITKNGEEIYKVELDESTFEYMLESTEFDYTDKIEAIVTNIDGIEISLTRPVLSVKYDETGEYIEIKAEDDIELQQLKVTINDENEQTGTTTNKSFTYLYPVKDLKSGDSMLIEVTNSKYAVNKVTVNLK